MASLMQQADRFYCQFIHHGKRHCFALGKVERDEAEAKVHQVDYLLMRLKQGLVTPPPGMNIVTFLQFDGKSLAETPATPADVTLDTLCNRYLDVHRGSLEDTTVSTMTLHFKHLADVLGDGLPLKELTQATLQSYADKRKKMKYRGRAIRPATIKKELVSLRTAWNWGVGLKLVTGRFPALKMIRLDKADEKPPFMTWMEIERRIGYGGLTSAQIEELWECMYLDKEEIAALLVYVREHATARWLFPLLATAAYTGARRSELIRIEISDVDFAGSTILVREKKRIHEKRTTRRISVTPALAVVLRDWLAVHPGGRFLFCHAGEVAHSKKRSKTTGHQWGKERSTSVQGRLATVTIRARRELTALTRNEVHDHLRRTLAGSKWKCLRGFHTLRHSFISCLASSGCDQRIIDEWTGHSTEEQRRRYRHLYPSIQQESIIRAFG